jgi:chromosome segregation ATPase
MAAQPGPDLIGWVRAGEHIFGAVLRALQEHEWHRTRADRLERENRQLQDEIEVIRAELAAYRAERVEVADTLRIFAEQVTQLAARAIERLARRAD